MIYNCIVKKYNYKILLDNALRSYFIDVIMIE